VKIVFVGTPEFAVPTLEAICNSHHDVIGVVTQPDRRSGRGRHTHVPPVKELALAHGVPVLQPDSINDSDCVAALRELAPDAILVVAYGHKISDEVIALPSLGCFNIHGSLLPKYRGAAPVHHAILNGDRETGVTIQRVASAFDSGNIIARRAAYVYGDETTIELTQRLCLLGADIIVAVLDDIAAGRVKEHKQDVSKVTRAPKLKKADGWIPWHKKSNEIINHIRGMTPWPGAFTLHIPQDGSDSHRMILLAAERGPERRSRHRQQANEQGVTPGKVVVADRELAIGTGNGLVTLLRVRPEGGKAMAGDAYLRGHEIKVGDWFRGPE
jgi:methionyl-tRNA formyltransferase